MRLRQLITDYKVLAGLGGVGIGIYLLALSLWPMLVNSPLAQTSRQAATYRKLGGIPGLNGNRLYIPQIGLDVAIVEGNDESALRKGAWHRQPQHGNPSIGGNFILSAHRFQLGYTPQGTLKKSPFYAINKLEPGHKLWVDYQGQRYEYVVSRRYAVKSSQTEIESSSSTPKLTLYSCTLRGAADGREVIEAVPKRLPGSVLQR